MSFTAPAINLPVRSRLAVLPPISNQTHPPKASRRGAAKILLRSSLRNENEIREQKDFGIPDPCPKQKTAEIAYQVPYKHIRGKIVAARNGISA